MHGRVELTYNRTENRELATGKHVKTSPGTSGRTGGMDGERTKKLLLKPAMTKWEEKRISR